MSDCPQPCMCPTCYAPYMDEPVTLEDKLAAPDPAAIREAALRQAAAVVQQNVMLHRDTDEALALNLAIYGRDAILALIPTKGAADDR